jgi:DNA-binding transcriptional regulator PaaX
MKTNLQKRILGFLKQKKAAYLVDITEYVHSFDDGGRKFALKYTIKRTLKKMEQNSEVILRSLDGKDFAQLTPEGRQKLRSLTLSAETHVMSMAWDGKWRVVVLDVPESDKEKRNALRYILKKAGFVCLKNSVWISPHPFEHMLENMKKDLDLRNEIMVILTDSLDPETELAFRESFWG